jgi:hypothetical protein
MHGCVQWQKHSNGENLSSFQTIQVARLSQAQKVELNTNIEI